jgi:hypothetical protein
MPVQWARCINGHTGTKTDKDRHDLLGSIRSSSMLHLRSILKHGTCYLNDLFALVLKGRQKRGSKTGGSYALLFGLQNRAPLHIAAVVGILVDSME